MLTILKKTGPVEMNIILACDIPIPTYKDGKVPTYT